MRITDVLKGKSIEGIITVRPGLSIREVAQVLADNRIGAAVVSEDGEHVVGIVNERDIVKAVANGAAALDEPLRQIMETDTLTCHGSDRLEELATLMTERRVRHVPVVAEGVLVGLVSIGDIVKSRIEELNHEKSHLENYLNTAP